MRTSFFMRKRGRAGRRSFGGIPGYFSGLGIPFSFLFSSFFYFTLFFIFFLFKEGENGLQLMTNLAQDLTATLHNGAVSHTENKSTMPTNKPPK